LEVEIVVGEHLPALVTHRSPAEVSQSPPEVQKFQLNN